MHNRKRRLERGRKASAPATADLSGDYSVPRQLVVRRSTDMPRKLLAPIAPLFRNLERDAEAVLGGGKGE